MGKLQKPATLAGTTRQKDTAATTGIKQFFPPSQEVQEPLEEDNMADGPTTSPENHATSDSATEVGNNIEGILTALAQIPNKTDLHSLDSDLKHTIHTETATLKQELANNEELKALAIKLFSEVLDDPGSPPINIERIHRAGVERLQFPTGRFEIKDQILQKARNVDGIMFEDSTVHLHQDLAVSTKTQRRLLKPVTTTLRDHNISYNFPFALVAQKGGKTFALRYPVETPQFCQQLDIPIPDLTEWRNYILVPSEALTTEQLTTPRPKKDFSPSRQWRKRLNANSPARPLSTPLNKRPP
ncbi:hypothetical protein XELAEV_18008710mg [Xenopus laevis]|uniref:Uncharacterized protein n=1 Tax=Xenopus laevis TaxID=8355 RepID=A0A974DSQ3_XENLA|nr:hypothetical protein XELAEV_18008710mg [Xenopus laevis]